MKLNALILPVRSDLGNSNFVRIKRYTILRILNGTDFLERIPDILHIVADPVPHKVDINCRTGGKTLMGKHKRTSFEKETLIEPAHGKPIQQALSFLVNTGGSTPSYTPATFSK